MVVNNQAFQKIKGASIANGFNELVPPPPSKYRILMSTEAARTFDDYDLRKVARHLSHSEHTSRKYYEFADTKDATDPHKKIKILSKQVTIRQGCCTNDSKMYMYDSDESIEY